jgi:hypothetical protein
MEATLEPSDRGQSSAAYHILLCYACTQGNCEGSTLVTLNPLQWVPGDWQVHVMQT